MAAEISSSDAAEVQAVMAALRAGDPGPLAQTFAREPAPHGPLMTALLADPADEPVARGFARIWSVIPRNLSAERLRFLRWYVEGEAADAPPARRATHGAILLRLLALSPFPVGNDWADLGFAAARLAFERGGMPGGRVVATRFLAGLDASRQPLSAAMVLAAIHAVDLRMMRQCLARWPKGEVDPALAQALGWTLGLVVEFQGLDPWLEALIEARHAADPQDALFAHHWAQARQHRGHGFAPLAEPLLAARPGPNRAEALRYGFWQAQFAGDDALAARFVAALAEVDPDWQPPGSGWAPAEPGVAASAAPPPRTAMPAPPDPGADIAAVTRAAFVLAETELRLDGPASPASLARAWARLAEAALAAPAVADPMAEALAAAHDLLQLDRREFSWITHFEKAPHAMGAARFGLVDLRLIPAMHDGVMAVIAALCQTALVRFMARDLPGDLAQVARLLHLHARACLEIDRPGAVEDMARRIARLGLLPDVVALLHEALALHRGVEAPVPAVRRGGRIHPFLTRADWTQAERVTWTDLATDAPVAGRFEVLWPDGRLEEAPHATPPGRLSLAHVPGLGLQSEDFVIGPRGAVLRPDPYHTSAEFPWPDAFMPAAGRRALCLSPSARSVIAEPVLVLEAFEALRWRNYYHWMVPLLTRIALALDEGLLDNRRLVVPMGLSGWMRETLTLLGLTEERLLPVPLGAARRFADAVLLSSAEHVSPACVAALRRRLLGPAPDPARAEGPALFLSRRGQKARRMANEEVIEEMAAEMGFQVIAPQGLGIAGQVRLFATARGVAAVEGAALTNTLFAPPGVRVLAMCCENDMMPIFNDLSIILGHHHRKLAGRGQPVPGMGNRFQPPFAVELDLARQSLAWVLDGPDPQAAP